MPLTVRKFNAQVKDPDSGQMVPAGLLSSDSLEAIDTAKTTAINAIQQNGTQQVAAIQQKGVETRASIPDDYTELSDSVGELKTSIDNKVPYPIHPSSRYGNEGQFLRSLGDGNTEWTNPETPTPTQIQEAVYQWMADNPDDRALINDGSITKPKFSDALKLETIKDYITPMMYGAVCDGVADDTDNFMLAVNAAKTGNKTLLVPYGYTLYIPGDLLIEDIRDFRVYGTIKGGGDSNNDIANNTITFYGSGTNAIPRVIDIKFARFCNLRFAGYINSVISVQNSESIELYANGSDGRASNISYSSFYLGIVNNLKIDNVNGGWINDNKFFGGRIFKSLVMDGGYINNNNVFYGLCLEGGTEENILDIKTGKYNYFYNIRLEGNPTIHFGQKAFHNVIEKSWSSGQVPYYMYDYDFGVYRKDEQQQIIPVTHINDENGTNLLKGSFNPYYLNEKLIIDKYSNNYAVEAIRKTATGISTNAMSAHKPIAESNVFDISSGVVFTLKSDIPVFRAHLYIYDENMDPITTEPSTPPFFGFGMDYNTNGYYTFTTSFNSFGYLICKYNANEKSDSGVYYAKIVATVHGLRNGKAVELNLSYNPNTKVAPVWQNKQSHADSIPSSMAQNMQGYWNVGDIVHKNTPSDGVWGWICTVAGKPGTWKALTYDNT